MSWSGQFYQCFGYQIRNVIILSSRNLKNKTNIKQKYVKVKLKGECYSFIFFLINSLKLYVCHEHDVMK